MASASDFLKKRTAARQQAESIQSSDKTPLGKNDDGTVTRASNFLRNKAAERRAVIDQQYGKDAYGGSGRYEADKAQGFNSWLESVNGLSSQLGSDYQSRDGKFQSAADFGKYRDDNDARISVMQNRANAYRTYFQDNREKYGEDTVSGVLSALDQGSKYLEELRGGLNSEYDFWSQFKDENDYNTYQRGKEYAALAENPDFAEKSQYKSTANGQEKFNAWSGTYSNSGFDDIAYDYINRNEEARSRQMLSDIQSNASLLGLDNSERREMTDDEIATFNYLYAQDTANGDAEHKNAYAYIDYLTSDLNYRQRAKAEEEWAAYAKEHPVGSSAFSVLESPLKGLSYLGQTADYLSDGEIDQYAGYNKFSYINSAIRNEVNTIVEDNWGGVGSFAYQTGMSMGDFLLNTAITGGNQALSLAIMGTGAAADATISAKDRGLSDNQAFALGTIAGAAEIITEKVSLDALLDKTALTKSAMGYFLKNTLAEGSEEVGSDIINLVADVLISKDKSEWQTSIDAYEAEGMTEKEAFWRAVRDQAENMGLDFLGGAVSGGVMSGAGIAINAGLNEYGARRTGAEFQAMGDDVVQATIQEGLASDPSTQSYKLAVQLQQKLDAGQTLTNAEIGRLYQANVQAIDAEDGSGDLLLRAAEEVTQKGRVTNNTAIDILSNPTAINTLTQEAGLNISEDMSKSQQRKAVKNAVATLARTQSDVSTNARETAPAATEARQAATQETVRPAMQVEQQRPAAQQAYDIRRVRDAAASLGENGAKALSTSYDGSVRADDYYAGFASYYEAGISGIDMDKVQSRYAAQLNQAQRFAAYSAGQNDAAASLALEREGVKSATVYGDEAGFVQSEHSASLPKETVRFYDSLARAAGVKIQMAEATGKGGANGWYSNGIIHIANDAENPGTVVAKHEITHRMQEMAPEAYRKYRDYAMSALTERDGSTASIVEQYKSRYAEAGVNLSTEQAMDEIAADFTEALTVDPARFETLAKENRSVARKLLDAVRGFIRKVKSLFKGNRAAQNQAAANAYGVSIDTLEEAARLWEEALKATSEQTANKNAAQTDGGTKFSIKRTSQMTLAQQLKMFYDGKMASSDAFYFGVTPAALEKSGFDTLPLAMTIGDFRKSTQKKHNIPRRVLKNLMGNLASPLFSFGSGDRAGIVLNDIDGDGYTLLAALERGTDMDRKPVNVINSLYGLEHPAEWIKNQIDSGNEFVLYDEKRANAFLQTYGYMASVGDGIRSTGESVTKNGAEVKTKFSLKEDNQGRELTEAQREYFRDSKAVDSDGRLKVMYRGGTGDFTVFDRKKSSYSNLYGRGFYFTDSEAHAKQYGNARAFYLNITTPVSTTETTITRDQMRKFLKAVAANEDDFSFENYGYDATVSSVLKSVYGKSDFAMLYDVNQTAIGDMVAAVELFNKVNGTNYDGLILDTETVAFQPNQIKSVTNQNPTSDPDIRYSLKEYTDEEKKQHIKDAAAYFGRTYKWAETGYITTDGRRLDFSGRHDGAPGGYRTVDHRDIRDALGLDYGGDDYSGSMVQFMAEGNIRISPESGGINLSVMPTKAQLDTLSDFISKQRGEVILDLDTLGGDTVSSTEYPRGTHANRVLTDIKAYFEEGKQPYVSEVSRFRYSLKNVSPVKPTGDDWKPGATFDEVKAAHPTLFALDADEADTRNPTQISGTVKSYRKIYDALQAENFDGTILDASSGLGYGTRAGREEYGFDVDDIEPFPDAKYQPNYTDYSALDKTYDVIISNAVLNVMPQDIRDAMVVKIGEMLNPGGRAFINVRGTDVKNAGSKVAINDDLMEYFISNTGSYQKGFTSKELVSYLKDALGDGFTVEPTRKFGAVSAIVTRDGDRLSLKGRDILQENAALQEENRLLREQMKDYIALQRRNGTLQESRDYWRGQTRRTQRVTTDKKAVTAAAKQLIQNYGADIAVKDIQGDLQSLYDYIASGYDGKDELTYTEARRRAEDIAQTLVSNAVAVDSDMYDAYSDLRDYLRTTKIIYGKEYHGDIADYGDFRKRQFGRLNLGSEGHTNIDQVYQELSSRWPEFFSEQEQTHPTDQLLHIVEVLDGISEINEYNPFSRYMDQAVTGAANEIMETFFDLPQTRKTFADRQALKLENAKAKGREQVQKVREQYTARLAELREQNRQRVQNAIAKERETRERQMGALKDRYAAKDAAGRERRAARELRAKITRHASALSQKLLRPSDQHHIPEAMRGSVAAMLESINQESQYTLDENGKRVKDGSGTPTKRTEAFRALKEQYAKIVAEGGDMVIDPSLLGSDADGIKGGFDAVIAMKDTKLADMSVAQLQTVWQVVKAVEHSVNTAGKVLSKAKYARTADWAQAISIGTSSRRSKNSLTRNHALIDLETPYTFFSHYGEAGKAVYRMLRDAQDQQQLMVDHVAEEVRKIVDPKTVKKLETATQTFTTERGEKLTLSTAQVMELYELVKRKQAHDHLLKGGVVQPEIKTSQIRRGTDSIRLTEGDLANITGTLTPEQVKIADGLQGLTRGVLADYGNRASMEAYGYKKFTESDYWPIKSAKEGLHSNIEKGGNNTRSIKNIGMAKTTMPHASNALDLAGIFTTFANHASDMTDYASWLCTMEDINRLFNYQFRDEEGNPTGKTIKGLLDRVGGPGSQEYWHNLMEDIQNGINAPGDSPMWDIAGKTIGGFKGAAVGANIRVVIQQPTAFFRAAAVLDPQDMARGLARGVTRGNGWKKALQYSPIAMRKDAGGFDISSPYQMTETLFDNRTNVRKLNDALSAPAGAADAVTWGKLWNACEWATAREHQGLTKGSEAFYRQTAKLFAEVIDQTQVVDGVLQRSNIMRSSNAVVKQATSFMGEPIMSLNLLMRAYDQVRYEQNSQKRGKAIKTMGRAATALVVTNVVNALAQSLIDAMRDDDEDKKYWERFRAAFTGISGDEETPWEKAWNAIMEGNVGSNMNPLGQIPFVKDALSIMQGYDVSRTEMEIVSDLIQAGQTAIQSADGQGKRTRAYALKGLLAAGAKMFGIPASNLTRDMWGLARSAAVETGNIPLQYEMEKAIYNISNTGNKNRYYAILYRALEQGDMDAYQHIRDDLMNSMGVDGASIDSAMRSRYNKAVEKEPDYTLPQRARDLIGSRDKYAPAKEKEETFGADDLGSSAYRAYSDQRANDYRSMADDLTSSPIFQGMDDETRDKVLKAAYDLADKSALADHSDGQYEVSTKWMAQADDAEAQGIEPWEYVLFHTAYNEMEGTKDADGKTVKGEAKSDHVREWLEDFSGLTDEQRAFLWGTVYTSEW